MHLYPPYQDRGTAETFIEELDKALKADRLSCHRFVAKAFRLILYGLAYEVLRVFRGKLEGTASRAPTGSIGPPRTHG